MPRNHQDTGNSRWLIAVAAACVIAIAGFLLFRANAGPPTKGPAPIQVRPGMYDFRTMAAQGKVGNGLKSLNAGR